MGEGTYVEYNASVVSISDVIVQSFHPHLQISDTRTASSNVQRNDVAHRVFQLSQQRAELAKFKRHNNINAYLVPAQTSIATTDSQPNGCPAPECVDQRPEIYEMCSSSSPKIFFAMLSTNASRRSLLRRTWLNDFESLPCVTYRFFVDVDDASANSQVRSLFERSNNFGD